MDDGLGLAARETRSPPRAGGNIRQRTQQRIHALTETSPKYKDRAVYEVALRVQSRGVSSHNVLSRAFGDASVRT